MFQFIWILFSLIWERERDTDRDRETETEIDRDERVWDVQIPKYEKYISNTKQKKIITVHMSLV